MPSLLVTKPKFWELGSRKLPLVSDICEIKYLVCLQIVRRRPQFARFDVFIFVTVIDRGFHPTRKIIVT